MLVSLCWASAGTSDGGGGDDRCRGELGVQRAVCERSLAAARHAVAYSVATT
jgi:hypothetical protein